jgi:hypothetical protein
VLDIALLFKVEVWDESADTLKGVMVDRGGLSCGSFGIAGTSPTIPPEADAAALEPAAETALDDASVLALAARANAVPETGSDMTDDGEDAAAEDAAAEDATATDEEPAA